MRIEKGLVGKSIYSAPELIGMTYNWPSLLDIVIGITSLFDLFTGVENTRIAVVHANS